MTNPADHLKDATAALREVRTDRDLSVWHDTWLASEVYMNLPDATVKDLEAMHSAAFLKFMPAMLGG